MSDWVYNVYMSHTLRHGLLPSHRQKKKKRSVIRVNIIFLCNRIIRGINKLNVRNYCSPILTLPDIGAHEKRDYIEY